MGNKCCIPRPVPTDKLLEAARAAIKENPLNRPATAALGMAAPGLGALQLAAATSKYWGSGGVKLTVGFIDTTPKELRTKILAHMNAWNEFANVKFNETKATDDANVRIFRGVEPDPNWQGYWSFLGTDIKVARGPSGQTMNLEEFTLQTPDEEFFRVVRHEAGHTLGFEHEHMRADLINRIDKDKAIAYFLRTNGWTADMTTSQVLTPLAEADILGTELADEKSIMCYQLPGEITKDGKAILGGLDLSANDKKMVAKLYPKKV